MVFSGPKRVFFVPKKGVFRVEYTCQSDVMYKSLKMLWIFFGELGHGADPRARKNLVRLDAGELTQNHGQIGGRGHGHGRGRGHG